MAAPEAQNSHVPSPARQRHATLPIRLHPTSKPDLISGMAEILAADNLNGGMATESCYDW